MRCLASKTLGVLFSVCFLHVSVDAAEKIRIAIPASGPFLTFALAQKRGFFKDEGLEAEIIQIRGGSVAMAALLTGELDYYSVVAVGARSAIQGLPTRLVACYLPTPPNVLVARPEFNSVKDLKGKTIAVSIFGSPPHLVGQMILRHYGLDPEKEVKFVPAGQGNESRLARMTQGLAEAAVVAPPFDFVGKKMGFHVLANAYELFTYPDVGLIASAKKIKEKRDEVKRAIKAGITANRYIRANREGTVQVLTEWLKTDGEIAGATYDFLSKAINDDGNLPERGFRLLIEDVKKPLKIDREVSFSEVADLSILRQAQKELGIKGN
jgi:ABC-type nitrate/sulfonate/bicarbonate transport system substrate-binding protein